MFPMFVIFTMFLMFLMFMSSVFPMAPMFLIFPILRMSSMLSMSSMFPMFSPRMAPSHVQRISHKIPKAIICICSAFLSVKMLLNILELYSRRQLRKFENLGARVYFQASAPLLQTARYQVRTVQLFHSVVYSALFDIQILTFLFQNIIFWFFFLCAGSCVSCALVCLTLQESILFSEEVSPSKLCQKNVLHIVGRLGSQDYSGLQPLQQN